MPDLDPSQLASHVTPQGLAAVTLGVCCALGFLSFLTIILRTIVRWTTGHFGYDDGLMIFGFFLFLADCGVVSYGCFVGIGSKDALLNPVMSLQGVKYVIMWQIFYVTSLCSIKCAICMTLLRIAVEKIHRILVHGVIVMTCITSLIGFIGVLTVCRPVHAHWTPNVGECAPTSVITNLSYLVSASSIVTDWACAILPIFILWKTQMKTQTKISVAIVLTLGAVASVTTIARMPFLKYYKEPENNFLYHMGFVIVLSIAECGIGLIAGSLPMLRRMLQVWTGKDSTESSKQQAPISIVTFGGSGGGSRGRFTNPTDRGTNRSTVKAGRGSVISGEWEQLDDGSSNGEANIKGKNSIRAYRTVTVDCELKDMSPANRTNSTEHLK